MILQEVKENSALKLNNWHRFLISCDSAFFSKKYFVKNINKIKIINNSMNFFIRKK